MNRAYCVIPSASSWLAGRSGAWTVGLVMVWIAASPNPLWGQQWNGTNPVWTNSNVGIGTAYPDNIAGYSSLTLNGSNSGLLTLEANGSVFFRLYGSSTAGPIFDAMGLPLRLMTDGVERMRIHPGGNVGIGTTSPVHTLQVAGTIGAKEVLVTSTGADYVFQPN